MSYLNDLDHSLFIFLNRHQTPFWDTVMFWISDKYVWFPFYLLLIIYIIYKFKKKSWILVPCIGLSVAATDFISSAIFKPWIGRLRPCHDASLADVITIVNNHCGGTFGFMSSHAANSFVLAMILTITLDKSHRIFKIFTFLWALTISYSRVYLGVHFPGDILAGALLGMLSGYVFGKLYQVLVVKYFPGSGITEH